MKEETSINLLISESFRILDGYGDQQLLTVVEPYVLLNHLEID